MRSNHAKTRFDKGLALASITTSSKQDGESVNNLHKARQNQIAPKTTQNQSIHTKLTYYTVTNPDCTLSATHKKPTANTIYNTFLHFTTVFYIYCDLTTVILY